MDKQSQNRQFVFWCKRLIRFSILSMFAAVTFETNNSIAAPRGRLENWRFSPQSSQLEISLSSPSRPQYFYLSQPSRIVVDLPDTKLGYVPTQQNYNGAIQRIRVSQLNDNVTRIVMDLAPGTFFDRNQLQLQTNSLQNPTYWVLSPAISSNGNLPSSVYPSVGGELPPGAYSPDNYPYIPQPPRAIQPSQNTDNLPPGTYTPPQAPFQAPSELPPGTAIRPSLSTPLPAVDNGNIQRPSVTVPPFERNNFSPRIPNRTLPPASFPSPLGNLSSPSTIFPPASSNLPAVKPSLNNSPNNSGVIEFGQPFPLPNP